MQTAGYSGTPLAKKLGIKPGFKIALINAPDNYPDLFSDLPTDVVLVNDENELKDLIHIFIKDKAEYIALLPQLKTQFMQNGSIWASWPQKASKTVTDVTGDLVRNYALQSGLVDVKVCAVDEVWSGLKLMIKLKDRV